MEEKNYNWRDVKVTMFGKEIEGIPLSEIKKKFNTMENSGTIIMNKWETEKDMYVFTHKGLQCLILRMPHTGVLNGYCEIPTNHPYAFDKVNFNDMELSVHGGITYAGNHLNFEFDNVMWWVGFDTAHCGDIMPKLTSKFEMEAKLPWPVTYKDYEYVKNELMELVEQILKIK